MILSEQGSIFYAGLIFVVSRICGLHFNADNWLGPLSGNCIPIMLFVTFVFLINSAHFLDEIVLCMNAHKYVDLFYSRHAFFCLVPLEINTIIYNTIQQGILKIKH